VAGHKSRDKLVLIEKKQGISLDEINEILMNKQN
jgi:hypothetical protein